MEPTMEPTAEQVQGGVQSQGNQQQTTSTWFPGFGTPSTRAKGKEKDGKYGKEDDDYSADEKVDDYQKDYHKEDDDGGGGRRMTQQ